jgi:hypothetical protein
MNDYAGGSSSNDRRSQHPHPTATHNHNSLDNDWKKLSNDQKEAAELLRQAPRLLQQVEESYLLRHHRRNYPTFHEFEVVIGARLGVGGFGVVFQIENLSLQPEIVELKCNTHEREIQEQPKEQDSSASSPIHDEQIRENDKSNDQFSGKEDAHKDESHYEVQHARQHMARFVRRDGEARYAIKRLHEDLPELARARGQIDLAMEALFLSGLWHPNISKFRRVISIGCQVLYEWHAREMTVYSTSPLSKTYPSQDERHS